MRSTTRDRLEAAIRHQRLVKLGLAVLTATAFAVAFWLASFDISVESHQVVGRVDHVASLTTRDSRAALLVDVALDDGRHARVVASRATDPHVGDRVTIAEHVHASGRTTFTWR